MKLIPYYLIDIIYKTLRPSDLKKLQIIQNIINLVFQVISIFFNSILIKQVITFSTPFYCWGKHILKKDLPRGKGGGWGEEQVISLCLECRGGGVMIRTWVSFGWKGRHQKKCLDLMYFLGIRTL